MSLINCPECNQTISNKSRTCVHCGCPINFEHYKILINSQKNGGDSATVKYAYSRIWHEELTDEKLDRIMETFIIFEADNLQQVSEIDNKLGSYGVPTDIIDADNKVVSKNSGIIITTSEQALRVVAILIWIAGVVAGIMTVEVSWGIAILCWVAAIALGMLVLGLADVLKLLTSLDYQFKKWQVKL